MATPEQLLELVSMAVYEMWPQFENTEGKEYSVVRSTTDHGTVEVIINQPYSDGTGATDHAAFTTYDLYAAQTIPNAMRKISDDVQYAINEVQRLTDQRFGKDLEDIMDPGTTD